MKKLISIFALVLVLVGGTMAFRSADNGTRVTALEMPANASAGVFSLGSEYNICVSGSPDSVSLADETNPDASQEDALPNLFLVIGEDNVCASLSHLAMPVTDEASNPGTTLGETSFFSQDQPDLGAEPGVWYVQH